MLIVECELEETLVEVAGGKPVVGLMATCGRCGHCVELPGSDSPELRRKLLHQLHMTCPEAESNRYRFEQVLAEQGTLCMHNGDD